MSLTAARSFSSQPWCANMLAASVHTLHHATDHKSAVSILHSRTIHGSGSDGTHLEAYPHFVAAKWPPVFNGLPVRHEVTLVFECHLQARAKDANDMPKADYLEIYGALDEPWQCCIHPDSPPLIFIEARVLYSARTSCAKLPCQLWLDLTLARQIRCAAHENRRIQSVLFSRP